MTLVPHDALRLYVIGERAAHGETASEDDLHQMHQLLREAMADGAAGFSMGSTETHRTATGRTTPSFQVSGHEMNTLATAFHGLAYRVLQSVDDFSATRGDPKEEKARFDYEYNKLETMARVADRPIAISWMNRVFAREQSPWPGEAARRGRASGVRVPRRGYAARPGHDDRSASRLPRLPRDHAAATGRTRRADA
jgi:hypothetical protein